ncbi:2319_t:CDS:1, partial [Ambispora gerdemannii]
TWTMNSKFLEILNSFYLTIHNTDNAHSYIVDFDDENVKTLFTDVEWNELTKDVPRDIAEELTKYGSTIVIKSYLKDEE